MKIKNKIIIGLMIGIMIIIVGTSISNAVSVKSSIDLSNNTNSNNNTSNSTTNNTETNTTSGSSISEKTTTTTIIKTYDIGKVVEEYNKLTEQYSNNEIAKMLEDNQEQIAKETGLSPDLITGAVVVLKTTETEHLKTILNDDEAIQMLLEKLEKGEEPATALADVMKTKEAIILYAKMIMANEIVTFCLIILVVFAIYEIIIQWAIFHKAGKHGWATLIPIYRDIVYYQVCGLSPWLLLLIFVPVIGWLILYVLHIVSRFRLAKGFGHGFIFGLFVWLLPVIFEAIIACQSKPYIGFDNEEEEESY